MQKKLIALAVAGLASGAAFAQTNVTMYGIADAGYVYSSGGDLNRNFVNNLGSNNGNPTFSGIASGLLSGSRLGFRGSEALGNGLKAVFTLEYSLNIDNNSGVGATGGLNARQQFVGLSSDKLGTVALGRQYAPGYVATVNNDAIGGAVFSPQSFLSAQAGNTITPNSPARWDNAITYTSPNWSGFTAKAIYSFGEAGVNNSTSDNGKWGIGGNYANGPLNLDVLYQSRTSVVGAYAKLPFNAAYGGPVVPLPNSSYSAGTLTVNGTGDAVNEYYVGGSYDFKVVKVLGSWQQQNDKNIANLDNSVWSLGAVIPVMAASNVHISYGQLLWDNAGVNAGLTNNRLDNMSQSAALAWTTNLSKRTTLYTGYVWVKNQNKSTGNSPDSLNTGVLGETNNTFLAGMRHSF